MPFLFRVRETLAVSARALGMTSHSNACTRITNSVRLLKMCYRLVHLVAVLPVPRHQTVSVCLLDYPCSGNEAVSVCQKNDLMHSMCHIDGVKWSSEQI